VVRGDTQVVVGIFFLNSYFVRTVGGKIFGPLKNLEVADIKHVKFQFR